MRFSLDDIPRSVPVEGIFISQLPSTAAMTAAWSTDPWVTTLYATAEGWTELLGIDVRTLMRGIFARVATSALGIIRELVEPITRVIKSDIIAPVREMIEGLIQDVVDGVLDAIGGVPIVGWVVDLVRAALRILVQLVRAGLEVKQIPLATFDKQHNDTQASEILRRFVGNPNEVSSMDWMDVFRPPFVARRWAVQQRTGGLIWSPVPDGGQVLEGAGLVPDRPFGCTGLNMAYAIRNERRGASNNPVHGPWDSTELTPSVGHLALTLSEMMKARTPALFQFDTSGAVSDWTSYCDNAIDSVAGREVAQYDNPAQYFQRPPRADAQWMEAFQLMGIELKYECIKRLDAIRSQTRYATFELFKRQNAALQTDLVAYCSETQAAFRNEGMKAQLLERRRLLLQHGRLTFIRPSDIVDEDFRRAFESRPGIDIGDELRSPGGWRRADGDGIKPISSIPPGLRFPNPDDLAEDKARRSPILLFAALGMGAWAIRRALRPPT